ncbi:NlpC/P60 family N-terminal domain-containing protein, partial [Sulfurovum sp.]
MYRKLSFIIVSIFSFSTLLSAQYMLKESHRKPSKIDHMPKNKVADMWKIPQDPAFYAKQIKPWPKARQKRSDEAFNRKYFKPWKLKKLDIPLKDFGWEVRFVSKNKIYTEKRKQIPASVYRKWIQNANYTQKDTKRYKAITTERTNVKALPTSAAFYLDPHRIGEGFPFNYNQNSTLHMNV